MSKKVASGMVPGTHGSTFGGNYLSSTAALEVLKILEEHQNEGKIKKSIQHFSDKLTLLFDKYQNVFTKEVGLGLMRGLRVKDEETLSSIINNAFDERVLVLKAGKNTLRFLPPLTITQDEIDEGFKRLDNAISKI